MAVVVFWPHRAAAAAAATAVLPDEHDCAALLLLGFRADAHTLCVVALVRAEKAACNGADVLGYATLVPPAHIELQNDSNVGMMWRPSATIAAHSDGQLMCAARVAIDSSRSRWRHTANTRDTPLSVAVYSTGDSSKALLQRCSVVLYDDALAATGWLSRCGRALAPASTLRLPLLQIGAHFETRADLREQQRIRSAATHWTLRHMSRRAVECVGYYTLFAPSKAVQRVATAIDTCITARLPHALPAVGGKCAKDASRFLELLSCYAHALAQSPRAVRDVYKLAQTRRVTDAELAHALGAWDFLCYVAIDVAVGRLLATVVFQLAGAQLTAYDLSPAAFLNALRSHVVWLMGAPAGFKLNAPLASILGNGILLWFDLGEFALSLVVGIDSPGAAVAQFPTVQTVATAVWRNVGATLQLTLLADVLAAVTWNSYWVYQYFTKLNMLQLGLFSSLWKLFVGKKNNVLRKRVDSCEYDVSQLLLGTLLFTILFFIVTTNMVFFVYFGLVRLTIFAMQAALWLPVVALRAVPLATLAYRIWHPTRFIASVQLHARCELAAPTATLQLADVGVSRQRTSDSSMQKQIHAAASTCGAESAALQPSTAYFELVPIAASASTLFQRLRTYVQVLTTQYALGALAQSWFFGSRIAPIPLAVLFDCAPASSPAVATAASTAQSPSAQHSKAKKDA